MLEIFLHCAKGRGRLLAEGHTGYAEEGKDIVCAGVSALLQTFLLWLIEEYNDKIRFEKKKGFLDVDFPLDDRINLVLKVLWKGLKEIEKVYSPYVRCKEVIEE